MQRRVRLGWLGPSIVVIGAIAAGLGTWYMVTAKPKAGAVIDTIAIGDGASLVVRAEAGGDRNFIELRRGADTVWQALVPTYAGRPGAPGLAWNHIAVSVRVIRDRRAKVFAIAMRDGSKLGTLGLAPNHGEVTVATTGPVTLTDHQRSYEVVSGPGWSQLVAIDLSTGEAKWRQELGAAQIDAGGVADGMVWLRQRGLKRAFRGVDGVESGSPSSS
ncbi:MAG: hypothetical protein H0T89_14825 [Deltaproteobacteria bacterium]|nr:hypothetical protein [Deltaproteobacteria bacterium]MDQ3295469.1 hypothetical protein [Myxococcota bacterium]